jgi:N-acetylglucosamine-6-phosphate deacetylase
VVTLRIDAPALALPDRVAAATPLYARDGRVLAIGGEQPADATRSFAGTLLPGLVDLQVNGAGGADVASADAAELDRVAAAVWRGGAVAFLPTLISAPLDRLCAQIAGVAAWIARGRHRDATPLGIHVEGPFLATAGAHDPAQFVDPTPAAIDRLLEAGGGRIRLVTLAPDRDGAPAAVARLREAGVAVALGHGPGARGVAECVAAGARFVTHLGNAMGPVHQREPGLALQALDEPRLSCGLILDGEHLQPAFVRLAWRLLGPERFVVTTDATSAAGMPDGPARLGGRPVDSRGGAVRDAGGRLAGSALTMAAAIANLRRFVPGLGAWSIARVAAANPARLAGAAEHGAISPGAVAAFTLLHDDGRLEAVRPE